MKTNQVNTLVLAYIGDSIYELFVREHLINKGINNVNDLQKEAKRYVTAKNQSVYLDKIISNNLLTESEIDIVKRARNSKVKSHPKNTDIITYKYATGLEALIGYLYLEQKKDRINEIMKNILE
jgi:ribonuclease-3 family protein